MSTPQSLAFHIVTLHTHCIYSRNMVLFVHLKHWTLGHSMALWVCRMLYVLLSVVGSCLISGIGLKIAMCVLFCFFTPTHCYGGELELVCSKF